MVFPRVTEYDDIIQVGAGIVLEVVQELVHHMLKGCRSPSEAEWHVGEAKQAEWCSKCCFLLIVFGYGDLPIPFRQVKCIVMKGAPPTRSMRSSTLGIGYGSTVERLFSPHRGAGMSMFSEPAEMPSYSFTVQ